MDEELIQAASSLVNARTDDANHTTAAAARTGKGLIVTGMNVFHFTGGPCAELDAGELVEIVAVGDGGRGILSPCGRCRQVLSDLYPDLCVIVSTGDSAQSVPVAEPLPWGIRWDPERGSIPFDANDF